MSKPRTDRPAPLSLEAETTGSEQKFLKDYDASVFARPSATVDLCLFSVVDRALRVVLIERAKHPFRGQWAFPGGFIRPGETAEDTARRELREETGVTDVYLEQLYTFTDPSRDPRTWVITIAYYALVAMDRITLRAGDDAHDARWFEVHQGAKGPEVVPVGGGQPITLAFDHARILNTALTRIRGKLDYVPIGFQLLPEKFTLSELQEVHEAILGHPLDKRNFRAKVQRDGLVKATKERRTGAHRPAQLFRYADRPRE